MRLIRSRETLNFIVYLAAAPCFGKVYIPKSQDPHTEVIVL